MRKQNLSPQQVLPLVNKAQALWSPICGPKESVSMVTDRPLQANLNDDERQTLSQACFHLANLLATPWARRPQMTQALLYLERACQYGLQQACEVRNQY